MFDVCIIGAGVIGALIARNLSKYNLKICVLEKENDVASGTTKANSAIVHAGFDAEENTLKAKLNVLGSQMMESLCSELSVKYKNNGSLVIGYSEEDLNVIKSLYKRGKQNGVKDLQIISGEKVRELEPNLSKEIKYALYAPTGAIVCPYDLTISAIGNAIDNGVELYRNFQVEKIISNDNCYKITSSKGKEILSRYVINSAGLFADEIAKMIGDNSFTIIPRRGEYSLYDKTQGGIVRHTIFRTPTKMGKGILVTPTVDGNLLLGPTSEDLKDKTNLETTSNGQALINAQSKTDVIGIDYSKIITSFSGLRATTINKDFIINSSSKNFINVAGIDSPGLSSAPAIAIYVTDMLKELGLPLKKKENFIKNRNPLLNFREMNIEEKNEIIKLNPSYGKIVCRCELVTEGEIITAIKTNPKPLDLDGVKRRTRSQMGRCQGGFCSPYIIKLLSQELGVPVNEITKKGNNSFIISGNTKEENYD